MACQVPRPREPAPAPAATCVHHGMDGWPGADTGRRRRQGTGVKGQIEQRTLGPTLLCSSTVTAHPCQRTGKVTAIPALLAACCQLLARDMEPSLDRPVASHTSVRGRAGKSTDDC